MILGGLIGGGFLAILVLISREKWMGAGDIKIGLILGFLCGYPNVLFGIFSAFILGSIVGLLYIKIKNKTIKSSLPFAPFLIIATLLAVTYGRTVISWYWGSYF
jgi:prepilin signal peptidase PulO-like enzyme (type II secretory pathway)